MEQAERTFPTLRRWRNMSESEQDTLLDNIERRRRWRGIRLRGAIALLCVLAVAIGIALWYQLCHVKAQPGWITADIRNCSRRIRFLIL